MFVNTRIRIKGRAGMANKEYPTVRDHGSRRIVIDKVAARRRSPYFHVVTRATGVPSPVHNYHPTRIERQYFNLTLLARLGTIDSPLVDLSPVGMSYSSQKRLSSRQKHVVRAKSMPAEEDSLVYLWGLTEVGR